MIEIEGLTVERGGRVLVGDGACGLGAGTLTALVGRNGAGKSTLLRVLAGLDGKYAGRITIGGTGEMSRRVAVVTTERVRIANMRCTDVVALGRAPYTGWTARLSATDRAAVSRALADVGMAGYADRSMDTLSDGECQRVMIARALTQDTPVVLLDEPTSFLDVPNRWQIVRLLARLAHEQGKCILFSTHEIDIAMRLADKIMLIDSPHLVVDTPEVIAPRLKTIFNTD